MKHEGHEVRNLHGFFWQALALTFWVNGLLNAFSA